VNARPDSLYRAMVATGDDPDAPERVRVDHRGDRAVVTLDESDRLNVLSAPLVRQLRRVLQDLDADADVRSVVLTGADPGFSAGGDLKMMKVAIESLDAPEGVADVWRWIRREFGGIARLIAGSDTIFFAAFNGAAAGVGLAWVAMSKPLLRATADADWNAALTLEEFAEPTCFTTAAFAESVQAMLK
jgi:2-(1,2-epoxy-1,2-dihydrophenyl)acetyl-CoA isomerase